MKLDLRKDFDDIYAHLAQRVRDFDPAQNTGPGEGKSVGQIQFGFQCDQAGWVALVFDTRADANPDGEWNSHISDNLFERAHWQDAVETLESKPLEVVLLDGKNRKETEFHQVVALFGELLKDVLLKAKRDGLFKSLPKSKKCHMGVEEMDGAYGWPSYDERGKDDVL